MLKGVGAQNAKRLEKLGIFSIDDLVHHFPWRYDDLSRVYAISEIRSGGTFAIKGRINEAKLHRARNRRLTIMNALVSDGTGSLAITCFNQPYLETIFTKNAEFLFAGPVTFRKTLQMVNPV